MLQPAFQKLSTINCNDMWYVANFLNIAGCHFYTPTYPDIKGVYLKGALDYRMSLILNERAHNISSLLNNLFHL